MVDKGYQPQQQQQGRRTDSPDDEDQDNGPGGGNVNGNSSSIPSKVANFGYSRTGASTLGFLQRIESGGGGGGGQQLDPNGMLSGGGGGADHFNSRERYKSLIRQLPARTYVDKLVDIYFYEFNWVYSMLDRDVFDRQLQEWYRLPFNLLNTGGPSALPPDLRAFPKLLRDASGEKLKRVDKPVQSINPSVRGIWSPYHGNGMKV